VIRGLIECAELDMAVEQEHAAKDFGVDDVDLLELGLAAMNAVGESDEHVELAAADRDFQ